ncbi:MAG: hypothetical protein LQ346_005571 [Caloplaca aetnensis]|nr:MAG: hypothetical protein LQ346_005571 [Caloplaca aetnensis]
MTPKKPPLTHFLCLPLNSQSAAPQWQASLKHFRANAESLPPPRAGASTAPSASSIPPTVRAVPDKAIRPLGTLHLTIGVMSLTKPEQVDAAIELLRSLEMGNLLAKANEQQESGRSAEVTAASTSSKDSASMPKHIDDGLSQSIRSSSPPPLTLSFTGLKSMQSPKSASLLYTPPTDTTGRLYPFCQALKDRFTQENLMLEEARPLKLHATILNTIYAGKCYPRKGLTPVNSGVDSGSREPGSGDEHGTEGPANREPEDEGHGTAEEDTAKSEGKRHVSVAKKKGKRRKESIRLDARELLSQYVDFAWALDVRVEKLAICEMGAKKTFDDGGKVIGEEYTEVASIALP